MKSRIIFIALALTISLSASAEYTWELIKQPAFKTAYLEALGSMAKEKWLVQLSGPSDQAIKKTVNGEEYLFSNSCKPHACDTDNIAIAYSLTTNRVVAKLLENKNVHWLGVPSPEVQAELEFYYIKHFSRK